MCGVALPRPDGEPSHRRSRPANPSSKVGAAGGDEEEEEEEKGVERRFFQGQGRERPAL
jgi:hypothetical protein